MTYDDIKNALDAVNAGMTNSIGVILLESDFVSPDTELTDTQVKQVFMILGQAAEYKKVQGDINGYVPSIEGQKVGDTKKDVSMKEDEVLNEIDPLGSIAKIKDDFMAKFGNKGAKMAIASKNSAQTIWQNWQDDAIKSGMTATVETLSKWINKLGVDEDIIDVAFRAIGVPNIKSTLRKASAKKVLPLAQWMKENDVTAGRLNGNVLRDYLLDVGVDESDIDTMIKDDIGLKNAGSMLSKVQVKKAENAAVNYVPTPSDIEEPSTDEPTVDDTQSTEWVANDLYKHIMQNYEVDGDDVSKTFKDVGVKTPTEQLGDNTARKILQTVKGNEKNMFTGADSEEPAIVSTSSNVEDRMKATHKIVQQMGGSINKAKSAGQKAINGDVSSMSELQKLGIAILTARKKI